MTLEIMVSTEEMRAGLCFHPFCLLLGILPVTVCFDVLTAQKAGVGESRPLVIIKQSLMMFRKFIIGNIALFYLNLIIL